MIRAALLIGIPLVVGACFACAQIAPGPRISGGIPKLACNFASKVQVLKPNYDPNPPPGRYSPPGNNIQINYTLSPTIVSDLSGAFANAPPGVQAQLCSLDGVYINPTGCPVNSNGDADVNDCKPFNGYLFPNHGAWAFRSHDSSNPDKGSRYIAISGGLWRGGAKTPAISFPAYENYILQHLAVKTNNPMWAKGSSTLPTITTAGFASTNIQTSWVTVLAALAHELGHIRFVEKNTSGFGNWKFDNLRACAAIGSSTIDFFFDWNYVPSKADRQLAPYNNWRTFADRRNNDNGNRPDHKNYPLYDDIANASDPNPVLYTLLASPKQPWASFFAALSPDEDFVETYTMAALVGYDPSNPSSFSGPLNSLPVTIFGQTGTPDVPADLRSNKKQDLLKKISCIAD